MSLNTAVSGINAAQAALDVTSNDLANADTVGFRSGAQMFADIYPAGANADTPGIGVRASNIERSFVQGALTTTNNPLNLAIQGNGFFAVSNSGVQQYTRDGQFHIDPASNQLMDSNNDAVLGFSSSSVNLGPLALPNASLAATPTTAQSMQVSLNTADPQIATATPFSVTNPASYDESTSVTAYDSLGNPNQIQLYFRQAAGTGTATTPDQWQVYAAPISATGGAIGTPTALTTLQFNSSGALTGGATGNLSVPWGGGAATESIAFDLTGSTLANQGFAVNSVAGNGFPPGAFQSVQVGSDGAIQAQYSNGQTEKVGRIALASFANNQGLNPISGNLFAATPTSGAAVINTPGQGQTGQIASGQLEQSNVDLSQSLVNLITEQQAYEANTKTIGTNKQDTSALLRI